MKAEIAQNNLQVSERGITPEPGQDSIHELIIWKVNPFVASVTYPVSNCIQMIGEYIWLQLFRIGWDGKYFNGSNFDLEHSSNSRKAEPSEISSRTRVWRVFTAPCANKNADWNQRQLTDCGILANWNSVSHPYCFLSNQQEIQILGFLHVICDRNVSCPPPENILQR